MGHVWTVTSSKVDRPFGTSVVNGFDLDFETPVNHLSAFADRLRHLMDSATDKFYLSAAPQCGYPDANIGTTLDVVPFDIIQVQFYNNFCGISHFQEGMQSQSAFNFDVWDKWAQSSKNPRVRVLVGIPASEDAARKGSYTSGSKLQAALQWSKKYPSIGGVMMWDVAQLYANHGFLGEVVNGVGGNGELQLNQISNPATATISTLQSTEKGVSSVTLLLNKNNRGAGF
ncbi:hypothetical protein MY3957_006466 [Beauveria namnaoensis]